MISTTVVMDTLLTIQVVKDGDGAAEALERAAQWFHTVERCCSRFDSDSEVMTLANHVGAPVPVSTMLFSMVEFALAVADESGGAFDPTVGLAMERRGFNREYKTGRTVRTNILSDGSVSYRDVCLDAGARTITCRQPLVFDLGAVAKGFAIDMAATELARFGSYAIDAGGDLYLAGSNPEGGPWSVGIRHPRAQDQILETLRVSDRAVCTSGDYERNRVDGSGHILDPRTGTAAEQAASVTVVAPTAMLADALATAAFVLGPAAGVDLLERHGVAGLIVSPTLERHVTSKGLNA